MDLKQSTASQEILLGPFLDDDDGVTQKTGLTIANTDIKIFKAGGTTLGNKNSGGATEIATGFYYATLDATDTDTLGPLVIVVQMTDCLCVRHEFNVVSAAYYDWVYGSTKPDVNTYSITNDAITAAAIQNGAIDANTFAAGALDAVWSTAARTLTANTNLANLEVDLTKIHGTAITETAGQLAAAFSKFFDVGTPVLTCESVNQTGDSYAIVNGDHGLVSIQDDVDAIKLQTDKLTFEAVTNHIEAAVQNIADGAIDAATFAAGAIDAAAIAAGAIDAATLAADMDAELRTIIWNAPTADYGGAGTYGQAVEDILADTNELQVDDTPTAVAAVKTVVDAVKVQTDKLTFTVANQVDANIQYINDTAVTGDGGATPWGPA